MPTSIPDQTVLWSWLSSNPLRSSLLDNRVKAKLNKILRSHLLIVILGWNVRLGHHSFIIRVQAGIWRRGGDRSTQRNQVMILLMSSVNSTTRKSFQNPNNQRDNLLHAWFQNKAKDSSKHHNYHNLVPAYQVYVATTSWMKRIQSTLRISKLSIWSNN